MAGDRGDHGVPVREAREVCRGEDEEVLEQRLQDQDPRGASCRLLWPRRQQVHLLQRAEARHGVAPPLYAEAHALLRGQSFVTAVAAACAAKPERVQDQGAAAAGVSQTGGPVAVHGADGRHHAAAAEAALGGEAGCRRVPPCQDLHPLSREPLLPRTDRRSSLGPNHETCRGVRRRLFRAPLYPLEHSWDCVLQGQQGRRCNQEGASVDNQGEEGRHRKWGEDARHPVVHDPRQ